MVVARRLAGALVGMTAALGVAAGAVAPDRYPDRPVRRRVRTPRAGGAAPLARFTARAVEPILNTRIVIENKPGAGGTIGVGLMTRAKPDGYTLGFIFNGALTTLPNTMKGVTYTRD